MTNDPKRSLTSDGVLSELMGPLQTDATTWSVDDLGAILEHQLAATLQSELDLFAKASDCTESEAGAVLSASLCRTFEDMLASPTSEEALRMLKEYSKAAMSENGGLPRDVARVLYVTAILRARELGFGDISALPEARLEREARRCLTLAWLPERLRQILATVNADTD